MPKLTIDRVRPLIAQIRAGNFNALGAGSLDRRANSFYRKALEGQLTGQERLDAYDIYKLSLQLERSSDPRAIMALRGLELGTPGDGWIYGMKFEANPIPRNDFERRENDRDPSSELIARGQDWTIDVPLKPGEDKDLLVLRKVVGIAEDFPGVTLAVPESLTDKSVLRLYANHKTIEDLAQKLEAGSLAFDACKSCLDKDGKIIWELMLTQSTSGIAFNYGPKTTENLVNNDHGRVVAPDFAIITDVGSLQIRDKNEDSAGYAKLSGDREVWVVADGMGGHAGGALASRLGVEKTLKSLTEGRSLIEAVKDAHEEVVKANQEAVKKGERGGAGSTVVALLIDRREQTGKIIWVGDSRARFVTEDAEGILTVDHSRLFNQVRVKLREQGRDIELPITQTRMEEIEGLLDAEQAEGRKVQPDYNIRGHGNIIDAALGHGAQSTIGLVEFPLGNGEKPAKITLYSDGLVDGREKEIEAEIEVTGILRKAQTAGDAAEELLANAFSAGSTDNVTVAVINVKEGLNLAELKVISGEKFQQELIARMSDINYQMTMGELKYMVEVYLLNPGIVPAELIERTKQRALVRNNLEALELLRKIDPSIPPVAAPPPLPAAGRESAPFDEVSDSQVISVVPAIKLVTAGPTHTKDNWAVTVKYEEKLGEMSQQTAQAIGAIFRPYAKGKFFSVNLSNNLSVVALADRANLDYLLKLVQTAIDEKGWSTWFGKKERFYIQYLGREAKTGQPTFKVYRNGDLQPDFIKQNFSQ